MITSNIATEPIDVLKHLRKSPLEIRSLQSWLLIAIGIFVAMYSTYKGYRMFDPYPGFARYFRRRQDVEQAFDAQMLTLQAKLNALADAYIKDVRSEYQGASSRIRRAITTLDKVLSGQQKYELTAAAIADACNRTLQIYRDANVQVRDTKRFPPPAYFTKRTTLQRPSFEEEVSNAINVKREFDALDLSLKDAQEKLIREIPDQIRSLISESAIMARLETIRETAKREHLDAESESAGEMS